MNIDQIVRRPVLRAGAAGVAGVLCLTLAGCGGESKADAAGFGRCDVTEDPEVHDLETVSEDVLTVAVPLPSPGAYEGETPESIDGGYLYCLAAEIAARGGLEGIEVHTTSFEALVTAKTQNFDVSLWDIIVTPEREEVVDFATPYMPVETGVAVKEGADVSAEDVGDLKIGVLAGSRQETLVADEIQPSEKPSTFQNNDDMFNALLAGQIDVALNDTTTVMPWAESSDGRISVIAQYETGSEVAPLLPKDSANTDAVSAIVEDMEADGTLADILEEWLSPILGGNPDDLPVWTA